MPFSPYAFIVAVFSRLTTFTSIQALQCFGLFNLVFFLVAFYLFCKSVFKENHNLVATISVLLILFFWGKNPFSWSGFYNFMNLHFFLPYPSTFAMSLSFLILALVASNQDRKHYFKIIMAIILSAIVYITHPTTAMFLYIAIIAFNFSFNDYSIKQTIIKSAMIIVPGFLLCLLWPYYNILHLIFGNNADFHHDSERLYEGFLERNWPALLMLPGLFLIKRDKIFNFFLTGIIIMTLIYAAGYVFKVYGVSRLISNIMMFVHFLIAYTVVALTKDRLTLYGKIYLWILSVCITLSIYLNRSGIEAVYNIITDFPGARYYNKYYFLRKSVAPEDIILADKQSNWVIPAFSGKVIESIHPLYWVDDINERRADVASFFNSENSDSQRLYILRKYKPDYILIDHSRDYFNTSTLQWLKLIGHTVYNEDQLELIKIGK